MPLDRSDIPMAFRVYALEERTNDQDAAIERERERGNRHDTQLAAHSVTLAEHEVRIMDNKNTVDDQITTLVATTDKLANSLSRVMWSLIGFSLTIAGTAVATAMGAFSLPGS